MTSIAGSNTMAGGPAPERRIGLYTSDERLRRDASRWTLVQGVLAPLQFVVMLVSAGLVIHSLRTGALVGWADASVLLKTFLLYAIMITGSLWEKDVFGKYLFAEAFFWEDVVSMGGIALHTLYVVAWAGSLWSVETRLVIVLVAYAAYAINAIQFVLKLRRARLEAAA